MDTPSRDLAIFRFDRMLLAIFASAGRSLFLENSKASRCDAAGCARMWMNAAFDCNFLAFQLISLKGDDLSELLNILAT